MIKTNSCSDSTTLISIYHIRDIPVGTVYLQCPPQPRKSLQQQVAEEIKAEMKAAMTNKVKDMAKQAAKKAACECLKCLCSCCSPVPLDGLDEIGELAKQKKVILDLEEADRKAGEKAIISEEYRLEGVKNNIYVTQAFLLDGDVGEYFVIYSLYSVLPYGLTVSFV